VSLFAPDTPEQSAEPAAIKPAIAIPKSGQWGKLLAALRHEKGMSQRQLANAADMPRTFISKMERRDRPPTYVSVVRLSTAMQIDSCLLLDESLMHAHLLYFSLFADPFVAQVWELARGLKPDQLGILEMAVKTLSEGQTPFTDWMQIESGGSAARV